MFACLDRSPDAPRLPEVAPLVCRQHVKAGRQAETKPVDERVREAHAGEIDGRVRVQKRHHIALREEKLRECVAEQR